MLKHPGFWWPIVLFSSQIFQRNFMSQTAFFFCCLLCFLYHHKRWVADEGHLLYAAFVARPGYNKKNQKTLQQTAGEKERTSTLLLLSFVLALSSRLLFSTPELYIMHTMHEVHLVRETQHNPAAIVTVCVNVCVSVCAGFVRLWNA